MNKQFFSAAFQKAGASDDGGATYRVTMSSGNPDREKDRINPAGWSVPSHVPLLWSHDPKQLPIGKVTAVAPVGNFLRGTIQFPPAGVYGFADQVRALVDAGMLPGLSVGFMPTAEPMRNELGGMDFSAQALHELSVVNVPANVDAAIDGRAMSKWMSANGLKAGRVLSAANEQRIQSIADHCSDISEHCDALLGQLPPGDGDDPGDDITIDGDDGKELLVLDDEVVDDITTKLRRTMWRAADLTKHRGSDDIGLDAIPFLADPAARHTHYGRASAKWDDYIGGQRHRETGISRDEAARAIAEAVPELRRQIIQAMTSAFANGYRRARGRVD